jgi:hypothetical protein
MQYPVGDDARRAVVRLMSLSRRLDSRMVVESTPAPGENDYELEAAAFFFVHLIRVERVMFTLADGSIGFSRHKVLSASAAIRLRELEEAMAAYEAALARARSQLRTAEVVEPSPSRSRRAVSFDVRAWLANVLLRMR